MYVGRTVFTDLMRVAGKSNAAFCDDRFDSVIGEPMLGGVVDRDLVCAALSIHFDTSLICFCYICA